MGAWQVKDFICIYILKKINNSMRVLGIIVGVIFAVVLISAGLILLQTNKVPAIPIQQGLPQGVPPTGLGSEALGLLPGVSAQDYQYVYQQAKDTLTVTGTSTISASPGQVEIYLGADTERSTALQSQQDNAQAIQNIRNAVIALGIPADSIETTSFRVSPVWDYTTRPYFIKAYKTTHLLKITSSDTTQAGKIIDAAVNSGSNLVNNVRFSFTKDVQKQLQKQALELAGQNSREKADSIAKGLGVSIVKVVQASEGYVSLRPYYQNYYSGLAAGAPSEAAQTQIAAGDVDVSATVSVVYEIS